MPDLSTDHAVSVQRPPFLIRLSGKLFWPVFLALLLASVSSVYFIFVRTWQEVQEGTRSESHLQVEREVTDAKLRLATIERHVAELATFPESDQRRMSLAIPATSDMPDLLVFTEALAMETGGAHPQISIGTSAPQAAPAPGEGGQPVLRLSVTPLSFTFGVVNYEHAKSAIDIVQRSLRLLDIQRVGYSYDGQQLVIEAHAYSLQ